MEGAILFFGWLSSTRNGGLIKEIKHLSNSFILKCSWAHRRRSLRLPSNIFINSVSFVGVYQLSFFNDFDWEMDPVIYD